MRSRCSLFVVEVLEQRRVTPSKPAFRDCSQDRAERFELRRLSGSQLIFLLVTLKTGLGNHEKRICDLPNGLEGSCNLTLLSRAARAPCRG